MTQAEFWPSRIDARFAAFHKAHPAVYGLFVAFARRAKDQGARKIGAKAIAEKIRWECVVEARDEGFKLNNDYVSRYARLVAHEHPDLAPMLELRGLKS